MKTRKTPVARIALAAAFVPVLVLVPAALAKGKPGGGGSGGTTGGSASITGPVMVVDNNGDGLANWGDTIRFNVSSSSSTPYVDLQCFQNGVMVAEGWRGYFDGSLDTPNFALYAGGWTSGAADCTAYVDTPSGRKGGMTQLGSMSFHVNA
jgi:hypothetical protein